MSLWSLVWIVTGFTWIANTSSSCREGCPANQYEAKPCNKMSNGICHNCTICDGSVFEIYPCSNKQDRQCMHVAHPLLVKDNETTPHFIEDKLISGKPVRKKSKRLLVNTSHNVVVEDLHNTLNLETNVYITDTTQATDFHWIRESGIRVNIGLYNVHLIPEYHDVEHDGDNTFILSNPNSSENKNKFMDIIENYCRAPVPDYYTIILETFRDRITAATMETCGKHGRSTCPPGRVKGQTYLHRSLNEECTNMGTFPKPLKSKSNCFATTEHSPLLQKLFNQTYTPERPIPFPSLKCKTAQSRCQQCLDQSHCDEQDGFDAICCKRDCYTLYDCKFKTSPECTGAPVACAMGDTYLYTLQAKFENFTSTFQCHLKRRVPRILYEIFYQVELPGTSFKTPKINRSVEAKDLEFQSHGFYQADYVTVEHQTGIQLEDEFMMVSSETCPDASDTTGCTQHTLYPMKRPTDWQDKPPEVHQVSPGVYVAAVQFHQPFAYNTGTWRQDNDQGLNLSKLHFREALYQEGTGQVVSTSPQKVSGQEAFRYWVTSKQNSPVIRFTVPGNMSLLPMYFEQTRPELVIDESLVTLLKLPPGEKVWTVLLKGRMSKCPAYLNIRINDREDLEELFHQDALIQCPTSFNMTFHIPNWGQLKDKTFDMVLTDSVKTHEVYLTQLQATKLHSMREEITAGAAVAPSNPTAPSGLTTRLSVQVFAQIAGLTIIILLLLNKIYVCSEIHRMKQIRLQAAVLGDKKFKENVAKCIPSYPKESNSCLGHLTNQQICFVVGYVFFRVLYSLLLTFTVMLGVLTVLTRMKSPQVQLSDQKLSINKSSIFTFRLEDHWKNEVFREAKQVTDMQSACSFYITEMMDSLSVQLTNLSSHYHLLPMYQGQTSISNMTRQLVEMRLLNYYTLLHHYQGNYTHRVSQAIATPAHFFNKYLKDVLNSQWLNFVSDLHNSSNLAEFQAKLNPTTDLLHLDYEAVSFGNYLEIEEVEKVQLWPSQFLNRYDQLHPVDIVLPVLTMNDSHMCNAVAKPSHPLPSSTYSDSAQFFSPVFPVEGRIGPTYKFRSTVEEYMFLTNFTDTWASGNRDEELNTEHAYYFQSFASLQTVQLSCLILDICLVIYRFCGVYANIKSTRPKHRKKFVVAAKPIHQCFTDTPSSTQHGLMAAQTLPNNKHHNCKSPTVRFSTTPQQNNGYTASGTQAYSAAQPDLTKTARQSDCSLRVDACFQPFQRLFLCCALPKVLMAFTLLLLLYVTCCFVTFFTDEESLSTMGLIQVFVSGLQVQIKQMNWFLSTQASYYNNMSLAIYHKQMILELKHLQTLLAFFSLEQQMVVENYLVEACSLQSAVGATAECNISMDPPEIRLPLLPCNFIPITADVFSETYTDEQMNELLEELYPYLSFIQTFAYVLMYIMAGLMALIIVVKVAEVTIFKYLQLVSKHSSMDVPLQSLLTNTQAQYPQTISYSTTPVGPPQTEESDYDSDEGANTTGTWVYEGHQRSYHSQPPYHANTVYQTNTLPTKHQIVDTRHVGSSSQTLGRPCSSSTEIVFAETKV